MHTNNLLSNNQAFNGIYRGRLLQKSEDDIRVFVPGIYNSKINQYKTLYVDLDLIDNDVEEYVCYHSDKCNKIFEYEERF